MQIKEESQNNAGLLKHMAQTHHLSLHIHLRNILEQLSAIQVEAQNRHAQYLKKELIITGKIGCAIVVKWLRILFHLLSANLDMWHHHNHLIGRMNHSKTLLFEVNERECVCASLLTVSSSR